MELAAARDEVSRKVSQAADNADAMLTNAAGALPARRASAFVFAHPLMQTHMVAPLTEW